MMYAVAITIALLGLAFAAYETFVHFRQQPANDLEFPMISTRYQRRIRIAALLIFAGTLNAIIEGFK